MTARNSILLIIKQQPGIEYNALLNKITGNYGGIESARAALSRSLRYLGALGLVVRQDNRLFATGKGTASLNTEMRNKLLLRLNGLLKEKDASQKVDHIVEMLHTLIERSKQDSDLLRSAKGSAGFYISDIAELSEEVGKRIHSLRYLHRILQRQCESLKELDFPDYAKMLWSHEAKKTISDIVLKAKVNEIATECQNQEFLKKAAKKFGAKIKQNSFYLPAKKIPAFLAFIEKNSRLERAAASLYLGVVKIKIDYPQIFIIATHKRLGELLEK